LFTKLATIVVDFSFRQQESGEFRKSILTVV
jgi:hypothetical protein